MQKIILKNSKFEILQLWNGYTLVHVKKIRFKKVIEHSQKTFMLITSKTAET